MNLKKRKDMVHNENLIAEALTNIILQNQDILYGLFAERFRKQYLNMDILHQIYLWK